jgi:hypothetical protein
MILLVEFSTFAAVILYLVRWRSGIRKRNAQSWDSLLARLRPDWSARELSDHFLWKEGLSATPDDAWQHEGSERPLGDVPERPGDDGDGGIRQQEC